MIAAMALLLSTGAFAQSVIETVAQVGMLTVPAQQMSIASVIQKNVVENGLAELIIITYKVSRMSLELSLRTLEVLPVVKKVCSVLRVEDPNL